jgi:hypothetical protein
MKVELLHGCDCGNVGAAEENLKEAFTRLGLNPSWEKVDLDAPDAPSEYRKYSSPTILINGRDVYPDDSVASGGT